MTYQCILLDFDDTIVDFYDAEEQGFFHMTQQFNHNATIEDFQLFKKINKQHWEAFQQNKFTKEQILSRRFEMYFNHHNMKVDGREVDFLYREGLAKANIKYFDNTLETIAELSNNHKLYIVTNGVTETQQRRLQQTPLDKYMDGIFISEQTGSQKPNKAFFDYVFKDIGEHYRDNSIIVGDSLTSDILGAQNAGIASCWFNVRNFANNTTIQPTYEINNLKQLINIVK
ncbi:YjjG family noncanonical pyrimidine nucleotidase [Staphylococcus simiae]|uniref:YjjG family noncanonical pyrimidine nucleotidase n=1 Tax=Staphylococcus simiae TaxID=308354 RepID=UPI001A957685|nr:YjjG family noncanonical pyrimidine nucleotidase [Staphylococcus simiae]MBO1198582.1 YjjG family noncanonical pyrimidine nucleotidase [Staphylococcus simiae]MBO1200806.1 YjjG family noncanonical pyrimidine nucleotidase [Staphylococcus simiae]MBO1203014.1 YjjG family noncanonical pyrimidine nucleotidase [Staphylococcus simiae]MBO1210635.1 YjjG family noncanonical pyrimidine nucleotidase [Staphylococcus simiae]MBO1229142.1 YjjG family noncanonical pyrimidine nucleotidase [Staphylococcus simia